MAPRTRRSRGNRGVGTQGEGSITALWICNKWDRQRWCWLVVWNIWIIFPYIENVIIPTDFHIFQRGCNHQPEDGGLANRNGGLMKQKWRLNQEKLGFIVDITLW